MKLRDLTASESRQRLAGAGLAIQTGPFLYSVRTAISPLASTIYQLYADFPVVLDPTFADFHVSVNRVRRWPWVFSQAVIQVGGHGSFNPFPTERAIPYFEWGLNWCVSQYVQHHLVLHAATLERGGQGILLVGPSGAGKSTLCAALAGAGWRLLSDEFALVTPRTYELTALARPISLKNESIQLLRNRLPNSTFGPASSGEPKGTIAHLRPPQAAVEQVTQTARPAWILLLDRQPEATSCELHTIAQAPTVMKLIGQAFNYCELGKLGFATLTGLVELCACYRFTYSDLDQAVQSLNHLAASDAPSR